MKKWIERLDLFSAQGIRFLMGLGAASLFLGIFIKITVELYERNEVEQIDRAILLVISKLRLSALNGSAVDFTALGSPTVIGLFTLIGVILLWLAKDRLGALYLSVGSVGAGILSYIVKHFISRQRPDVIPHLVEVSGFSYPSGHSLAASAFYLILAFLTCRHFRTIRARSVVFMCATLLIGGVCLSRLYLGVHYPSDVVSGVALGSSWAFFITAIFGRKKSFDKSIL